jgi:hypothetical protein
MTRLISIASMAAVAAIAVSASAQTLLAHGLHTSCMYGSMAPDGQGNPSGYHTTPEVGVHIACSPQSGPKDPEFRPGRTERKGNTKSLSVRR